MKRITVVWGGLLSLAAVLSCEAAIATWTFGTSGSDLTGPIYAADAGSQAGAQIEAQFGSTIVSDGNPDLNAIRITTSEELVIHVSGAGYSSFVVSYDAKQTGSSQLNWAWSLDNSSYTYIPSQNLQTSWGNYSADFSGVSALNGAADVYLLTYASTEIGQLVSFDNIQVNAVPEPINVALALFGLGIACRAFCGRVYCRWIKS